MTPRTGGNRMALTKLPGIPSGATSMTDDLDPIDLPTPDSNGEPPPEPLPGEPETP